MIFYILGLQSKKKRVKVHIFFETITLFSKKNVCGMYKVWNGRPLFGECEAIAKGVRRNLVGVVPTADTNGNGRRH